VEVRVLSSAWQKGPGKTGPFCFALRRLREQVERGEIRHTSESFGGWWERWLRRRRSYLEPNAWRAYDVDGRTRLLPAFEHARLDGLDLERVRGWMEEQAETVEAGDPPRR
jgi:hypothetical protein